MFACTNNVDPAWPVRDVDPALLTENARLVQSTERQCFDLWGLGCPRFDGLCDRRCPHGFEERTRLCFRRHRARLAVGLGCHAFDDWNRRRDVCNCLPRQNCRFDLTRDLVDHVQAHGHAGALLVIAFIEPDGCADRARGKGVFVDFRKLCARREPVRHDRDDPPPLLEARYGSAQVTHRCELVCSSSH